VLPSAHAASNQNHSRRRLAIAALIPTFLPALAQNTIKGFTAVLPISGPERWAKPFTESLETAIKQSGLETVNRSDLEKLLREQTLVLAGVVDAQTAARVGKVAGAARVVTGSILPGDKNEWIANVRVVNSETAVIEASTIQRARVLADIPNLAKNTANALAAQLRGEPNPIDFELPSLKIEQDFNSRLAINNVTGYSTLGLGIASGVGAILSFTGANSSFQRAKTLDVSDPVAAKAARDSGNSSNLWGYVFTGVAVIGIGVALYFLFNPPQDPLANDAESTKQTGDQKLENAPVIQTAPEFSTSLQVP
jgi:Curli production assembly/transport component CsgG